MCEDSDQEISELDIESRNWNKMQENMKLIGFREGAVKGKDLSLQEGFNLGYSDGYKLGEFLGMLNGIISGQSELRRTLDEKSDADYKTCINLSNESCILCLQKKASATSTESKQIIPENFDDFLLSQQSHIEEVIKNIRKSDLKSHLKRYCE